VLVDHNLVQPAQVDGDDEPRFAMLETIREFGRERLVEAGELDAALGRHAAYYLAVAERLSLALTGPDQPAALQRLDREHANLQAALSWLLDRSDPAAFRLTAALWRFWNIRGHLTEGAAFLERVLALPGPDDPTRRAVALWQFADFAAERGDYAVAKLHLTESTALARRGGDQAALAAALSSLGRIADDEGDLPAARAYHEEALALRRKLADRAGIALSLSNLGNVAHAQGHLALSRTLHDEALALRRDLGQPLAVAYSLLNLGDLARTERRLDDALALLSDCRAMFDRLGDPIGMAFADHLLGRTVAARGDRLLALTHLLAALALRRRVEDRRGTIESIEGIAFVAAHHDPTGSARLLGAAAALRTVIGAARTPPEAPSWDEAVAAVATALGPDGFSPAWDAGQALTLAAAVTAAVEIAERLRATLSSDETSASAADAINLAPPVAAAEGVDRLSPREREVLRLMVSGATNRQIAGALGISPATAKRHVTNVLAKLDAGTRAEAVSLALRTGLVAPDAS
jgi:non-specific serine/threonine protein kinase